jgi:hypothetical protein
MFSATGIKIQKQTTKDTKYHEGAELASASFVYLYVLCGQILAQFLYMIAVGGAGSSGLPALDSGTFIMTKIRAAIAMRVLTA